MKSATEAAMVGLDQSVKSRRPKTREVSSRFQSPTSSTSSLEIGNPSPTRGRSPSRRKPGSSFAADMKKSRSQPDDSGSVRGLWPSSSTTSTTTTSFWSSSNKKIGTLADHLGNERLNDLLQRKSSLLDRQRSCREFTRFVGDEEEGAKENHGPALGGSMRYTGKFRFPGRLSSSSTSSSAKSVNDSDIVPGRLSVDGSSVYQRLSRQSDCLAEILDSGSECSDACDFPAARKNLKQSSRKPGVEVASKYMNDIKTRPRLGASDSNISNPLSSDSSPKLGKFTIKNAIKRANSLTGYGSATSQWALSPGRSGSPPIYVENKARPMSFSTLKPPASPSRTKGVEKIFSLGLELFKSKKSSSSNSLSVGSRDITETGHQLRLLQNRLFQWRYVNAKADTVNANIANRAEVSIVKSLLTLWYYQEM